MTAGGKSEGQGLRIIFKDFEKYGRTLVGCWRCACIGQRGIGVGRIVANSGECHQRIAEEFSLKDEGRARAQRAIRRTAPAIFREPRTAFGAPPAPELKNPASQEGGEDEEEEEQEPVDLSQEDVDGSSGDDDMEDIGGEDDDAMADEDRFMADVTQVGVVGDLISHTQALGGCGRRNGRRIGSKLKAMINEVYSPTRIAAAAGHLKEFNIDPGLLLDIQPTGGLRNAKDLASPWNFLFLFLRQGPKFLAARPNPGLQFLNFVFAFLQHSSKLHPEIKKAMARSPFTKAIRFGYTLHVL